VEFVSTRMCELLVGLPEVNVLAVVDVAGEPLRVHVETRTDCPLLRDIARGQQLRDARAHPNLRAIDRLQGEPLLSVHPPRMSPRRSLGEGGDGVEAALNPQTESATKHES
jgi:hypothetical protein